MAGEVGVEIADVQAKIGGLVLQVLGLERRIADLTTQLGEALATIARLETEARGSAEGPRPVRTGNIEKPKTWSELQPHPAEVAEVLGTR